jgi:hypothetical protein
VLLLACKGVYAGAEFKAFTNASTLSRMEVPGVSPTAAVSASSSDISGVYKGNGHYGDITITPRGGDYLVKTCGRYTPPGCLPIEAVVHSAGGDEFASVKAAIHISYNSLDCAYSMSLHLSYKDNQLWLSDHSPSGFPYSWSGGCPAQSYISYSDYIEPKAYSR